jgi:hypothetical protein
MRMASHAALYHLIAERDRHRLNNPIMVRARRRWVAAGWHPPTD